MWLQLLLLLVGFVALVWSADKFLSGAASTAVNFGIPKIIIGLTIVSLGTSAPEIIVATFAAIEDNHLLAVGNAIGSNIANIGLVLGVTAIITPLAFSRNVRRKELPWLIGATLLTLALLSDRDLNMRDGLILLFGLAIILWQLLASARNADPENDPLQDELNDIPDMSNGMSLFWLVVGLVILLVSAQILVYTAVNIAQMFGVSELIIGLTVIAIGTSLPELAATVGSALKGHPEIAIGNVVGSNILNILAVLAVPALLGGVEINHVVLWRDAGMMTALTMMLALFAYGVHSRAVITRFEGAVMLAAWIGYNLLLIHQA
ncbi:MAG TPA: calcium/sodium antiporter [Gammaproteobacteria bacterium]|mgnify:FL=1|nr:calcium/sodium antiporter [Gammaproteobacteria bacterium]|tara:strand:+ start:3914 stop:4873 length:960 start_codon:yes stop_codon:yes gene_type:complete